MRVLVTGAGGYVGDSIARALAASGFDVLGHHRRTPPIYQGGEIEPIVGDLSEDVPDYPRVDAVIHAAAHTHLESDGSAALYVRDNIVATRNLLAWARQVGVRRFLHLSTLSVYGEITAPVLREETPFTAPGLYGQTKYLAERLVLESGPAFAGGCLNVRLPGIVGPGYRAPWLGRVLTDLLEGIPVHAFNPSKPFNNVCHIAELARFCRFCLEREAALAGTVNLAASAPADIGTVLETMRRACGSGSAVAFDREERPGFCISTAMQEKAVGFVAEPTLSQVRRYARENGPAASAREVG